MFNQPQGESELEKPLLLGTLQSLALCVWRSELCFTVTHSLCVLKQATKPLWASLSSNTDWGFHSQEFISSKNLIDSEETWQGLLDQPTETQDRTSAIEQSGC